MASISKIYNAVVSPKKKPIYHCDPKIGGCGVLIKAGNANLCMRCIKAKPKKGRNTTGKRRKQHA